MPTQNTTNRTTPEAILTAQQNLDRRAGILEYLCGAILDRASQESDNPTEDLNAVTFLLLGMQDQIKALQAEIQESARAYYHEQESR